MDVPGQRAEIGTPAATQAGGPGFRHAALVYRSESQYLTEVAAFVRAAFARDDPVLVAVPGFHAGPLREVLGAGAGRVTFADMLEDGCNPGRIISTVQRFAGSHHGRRVCAVGEPAWAGRSEPELLETAKHEALSNLAFAGASLTVLCTYDGASLPPWVLATVAQTHPLLSEPGGTRLSRAYLGAGMFPPPCRQPLPEPPPGAHVLTYHSDLRPLRALVRQLATEADLGRERTADLAIAVSELAANTLRHAYGEGTLRAWLTGSELVCEICDQGWITDPLAGWRLVAQNAAGGHGLWVVNQVCDLVELRTGPAGTTARLHMRRDKN